MKGTKFGAYAFEKVPITVKWSGMDSSDRFEQHLKNPVHKQLLGDLGFLNPDCISYCYNSFGFRAEEFDKRPSGIALGCSFTEGVGLPLEATWPMQLSKMLDQHIWNLGVGGGALDTCYNLLEHYINALNPKFVVVCTPPIDRFEFFENKNPIRVLGSYNIPRLYESFFKEWFATEKNSETNHRKNILAMQQLCSQRSIPFYHLSAHNDFDLDGKARDLAHPGVNANRKFSTKMYRLMN